MVFFDRHQEIQDIKNDKASKVEIALVNGKWASVARRMPLRLAMLIILLVVDNRIALPSRRDIPRTRRLAVREGHLRC